VLVIDWLNFGSFDWFGFRFLYTIYVSLLFLDFVCLCSVSSVRFASDMCGLFCFAFVI